jgi:hypothetical protein
MFDGGLTLEAAESVGVGVGVAAEDVLDLLTRLVQKSLVTASEGSDSAERYGLLETVRDFARQKLLSRGIAETTAARERHAAFYSDLAQRLHTTNTWAQVRDVWADEGKGLAQLRDRTEELHDNLRTALGWLLDARRPAEGLRLAVSLLDFWIWSGRYSEARRWLQRLLESADEATPSANGVDTENSATVVPLALRADALNGVGMLASWQGDHTASCAFLEAGVALARELSESRLLASALAVLGLPLWLAGSRERSEVVLNECLERV